MDVQRAACESNAARSVAEDLEEIASLEEREDELSPDIEIASAPSEKDDAPGKTTDALHASTY